MNEIKFKTVKLKNFRCHEELEFDFSKNKFIVIVGDNGKGKTTIFDALYWCLWDETINGVSGDKVIRNKAKKDCSVELSFEIKINDKIDEYIVKNYRKDSTFKTSKIILKNNEQILVDANKSEIINFLENIIMPKDIFMNCLIFSQFMKKSFVELSSSDKNKMVDTILSLDRYDQFVENIKIQQKEEEDSILKNNININYKNKLISQIEDDTNQEKIRLKDIVNELRIAIDKYEEEIISKKTELSNSVNIKIKLENMEKDKEYLTDINTSKKNELIVLENEFKIKKVKISERKNTYKDDLQYEYQDKINDLENCYKDKITAINFDIEKINMNINNISRDFELCYMNKTNELKKEYDNNINELKSTRENLDKSINKLNAELLNSNNTYKSIISDIEYKTKIINDEIPICNECGQEIKDEEYLNNTRNELDELIDRKTLISKNIDTLNNEIIKIQENIDNINDSINNINVDYNSELNKINIQNKTELNNKTDDLNKSLDLKRSQLDAITNELSNTKDQLLKEKNQKMETLKAKYNFAITDIDKEYKNKIEEISRNISINESTITNKIIEIDKLKLLIKCLENKQHEIELINKDLNNTHEKLNSHIKDLINLDELYKSKISNINKEIKNIESENEKIQDKIKILNFWKQAFGPKGIKAVILDEAIPTLNKKAIELYEYLDNIRITFDSQKTLSSGDQRNEFSINAVHTQNLSEFGEFSAGEKKLVNIVVLLCMRHLLEIIQNMKINILLLDEILDSLDLSNSRAAIEIIQKLSKDHCVVLISHTMRDWISADEIYRF